MVPETHLSDHRAVAVLIPYPKEIEVNLTTLRPITQTGLFNFSNDFLDVNLKFIEDQTNVDIHGKMENSRHVWWA